MKLGRRRFLSASVLAPALMRAGLLAANDAPVPYGAFPTARQIDWSRLEFYNFLHFTINTFTDKEWGYGDESPTLFNPTDLNAGSIAEILKDAGSKGFILTAKHHDGFCLWPTTTTERSIKNSPYRQGKGDLVREFSEAAQAHGLKFGVYVSPWDRSQASYGTPAYLELYREQIRELLTQYGPLFEIWHDGANGGDGYYGGAREKRIIDKLHYYDWPRTWELERQLQPKAAIFSDVGPDVRWVGNERGQASEPSWATYTPRSPNGGPGSPGDVVESEASTGTVDGKFWMPAECDVSIRPGWFWHQAENDKVKTPRELMDLYYDSVGRGASFLLNVPPDRRGRISQPDARSLREFGKALRNTFDVDLASTARAEGSEIRTSQSNSYRAENVLDGNTATYWMPNDATRKAVLTLRWDEPQVFDVVRVREAIHLGQRIRRFSVETLQSDQWQPFGQGTSIGIGRILQSPNPVTTRSLRLVLQECAASPALSEVGVFRRPVNI